MSLSPRVCVCVCFPDCFSTSHPHPIIIPAIHLNFSSATAAFSWGPVMQSGVSVDSWHLLSKEGIERRQLKACPSFARLICPNLGGRDILGFGGSFFWQSVSSAWLVCSCLLHSTGIFRLWQAASYLGVLGLPTPVGLLLLIHFKEAKS